MNSTVVIEVSFSIETRVTLGDLGFTLLEDGRTAVRVTDSIRQTAVATVNGVVITTTDRNGNLHTSRPEDSAHMVECVEFFG